MASISTLTKAQLLAVLEHAPQQYWPPRPTRQDKDTLVEAVHHAHYAPAPQGDAVRKALAEAWAERRARGLPTIAKSAAS
jgi:hypothetical protein